MILALSIAVALVPALLNALWSRSLLRRREAADFAERLWRHRMRMVRINVVCLAVVLLAAGMHFYWLGPLLLIGSLAGGFRLRRTVFEESWSFAAYLVFMVRLYFAFVGFWGLLALTPTLLYLTAAPYRWPVAVLVALVLLLWNVEFSRLFPRIAGAEPLAGVRLEPFEESFDPVARRSSATRPALYYVPLQGGVFVNAVALPSLRRPGVVFWESLLELFEPAEVGAIYAHEVAHLEHFDRRRLRWMAAVEWTLVVLAVALPLALAGSNGLLGWLSAAWPLLVLGAVLARVAGSRRRETDADLRALELCGDAEALTGALTRLHRLARMPRRLALEQEERLSHPSLAHRLQAIREAAESAGQPEAAGGPAASLRAEPPAGPRPWPRVIPAGTAGRYVIFEGDRVSWLDGVPAGAATRADELRREAASTRTLVYGQLAELRVAPRTRGPALVATDVGGRKWSVPLDAASVAAVQRVLDDIDTALAPRTTGTGPSAMVKALVRLAAGLGMLLSLVPPLVFSLALPALVGLARLRPASAGAFGVAGVAAALLRLLVPDELGLGPETRWPVSILLLAISLAALGVAVAWARRRPEQRRDGAWAAALIHGAVAALLFAGALMMMAWSGGIDLFSLHQTAFRVPGLVVLPLAAAGALLFARGWIARAVAVLATLAAAGTIVLASPSFERAFVDDPLIVRAAYPEPAQRRLEEIARLPLDGAAVRLRLSPRGELWAAAVFGDDEYAWGPPWRWLVGRVDGSPPPGGELEAIDLQFVDERRLLLLRPGEEEDAGTWTVELRTLDGEEPPVELAWIDGLSSASLTVEPGAGRWWVSGPPDDGADDLDRQTRFSGALGTDAAERITWQLPQAEGSGYVEWTPAWGAAALASRWVWSMADEGDGAPLAFVAAGARRELWWVEGGEAQRLPSSRLDPTCGAAPYGPPEALCVVHHRGRNHLWRLTAPAAGPPALEPMARFAAPFATELEWTESAVLVSSYVGKLWRWDRSRGTLEELTVPDGTGFAAAALASSGVVGTVDWSDDGEPVLVFYRPAPSSP